MIESGLCLLTIMKGWMDHDRKCTIMKGWMDHDRKWTMSTDYYEGMDGP